SASAPLAIVSSSWNQAISTCMAITAATRQWIRPILICGSPSAGGCYPNDRSLNRRTSYHGAVGYPFLKIQATQLQFLQLVCPFPDLQELTGRYVLKYLADPRRRPFHRQFVYLGRHADTNRLPERIGAKTTS